MADKDHYGKLKRYDHVTRHVANRSSSYASVEKDWRFLDTAVDAIESIPASDAVIVWTHLTDTSSVQQRLQEVP